jgi:GntR family transcriptional regulator
MRTHNMSRGAVRDALNMLREEGLVSRVQGLGTFVVSPAALTRMVESHGMRPEPVSPVWNGEQRPHIIDCSVVPTPEAVATRLAPTVTDTCLRVEYVATLHGQPMGMACNYVSFPEAQALLEVQLDTDWYAYLRAAGLSVGSSEFLIGCAAADSGVARLLDVPVGRPVLTLEQLICDENGRPFNVAFCNSRSDRFGLVSIAVSERLQAKAGQRVRFEAAEPAPAGPERARGNGFLVDREPANSTELYSWLQQSSITSTANWS